MNKPIEIPKQLQKEEFRFILLKKKLKEPVEINWPTNNYKYNDPKLLAHIAAGKNYGVVCGKGNLIVIDVDNPKFSSEATKFLEDNWLDTFVVQSSEGRFHIYLKSISPLVDLQSYFILTKNNEPMGELRLKRCYIVGPNSIHPDTKKNYKIIKHNKIKSIHFEKVKQYFEPFISARTPKKTLNQIPEFEVLTEEKIHSLMNSNAKIMSHFHNLNKKDYPSRSESEFGLVIRLMNLGILNFENIESILTKSKIGKWIDETDNYRERTYLGALECHQKNQDGKIIEINLRKDGELDILNYNNIKNMEHVPINWTIKNLVPESGITYIGAPPKSYKTFIALLMGISVALGKDFLNYEEFPTKRKNVLYLDEENSISRLRSKIKQLENGTSESLDISNMYFISMKRIKFNQGWLEKLKIIIEKYSISFIIFDSLIRFMEGDEDRSTDVRKILDWLKELTLEKNISIMLLHHFNKSANGTMNIKNLRGSSDFGAMADSILGLSKRKGYCLLKVIESRDTPTDDLEWDLHVSGVDGESIKITCHPTFKSHLKTRPEKAGEDLKVYVQKTEIPFRTKDIQKYLTDKGHKHSAISQAIKDATLNQIMRRVGHGVYTKIDPDNKV
ncbi:MAG: AAA family ATPase [Nanoarchaeota archaeon]|nr:AAA family ATPase [Nanoarchaeota archaeon]